VCIYIYATPPPITISKFKTWKSALKVWHWQAYIDKLKFWKSALKMWIWQAYIDKLKCWKSALKMWIWQAYHMIWAKAGITNIVTCLTLHWICEGGRSSRSWKSALKMWDLSLTFCKKNTRVGLSELWVNHHFCDYNSRNLRYTLFSDKPINNHHIKSVIHYILIICHLIELNIPLSVH